jgi:ABC-type phosphate/phosphonate transport system substrate-binding protein
MLKIGAVAYAPHVVTIFEGIKKHFNHMGVPLDWVLYSNYDALVEAFVRREVDLAWNGPLAYVKIRRRMPDAARVVAMRDMDINFTTQFITHPDSEIQTVQDLKGKRFAFASRGSVQAGLLAYYFLKQSGVHLCGGSSGGRTGRRGRRGGTRAGARVRCGRRQQACFGDAAGKRPIAGGRCAGVLEQPWL